MEDGSTVIGEVLKTEISGLTSGSSIGETAPDIMK